MSGPNFCERTPCVNDSLDVRLHSYSVLLLLKNGLFSQGTDHKKLCCSQLKKLNCLLNMVKLFCAFLAEMNYLSFAFNYTFLQLEKCDDIFINP